MAPPPLSSNIQVLGHRRKRLASPEAGANALHPQRDSVLPEAVPQNQQEGSQDHSTTHINQGNGCSQGSRKKGLLNLPSELLQIIASQLCGSKDILSLALVNNHLSGIVQETMVRKLIIPQKRIKQFIESLFHRVDFINKITSVDLGDFDCSCVGLPNFGPEISKFLGQAIASNTENAINWSHIRQAKRNLGPVWRKNEAFFLDVLLLLCPNITSVTLEFPEASEFSVSNRPSLSAMAMLLSTLPIPNTKHVPVSPFQGPALHVMQRKLEVLTLTEDSRWKGPAKREVLNVPQDIAWRNVGKHTISLPGFRRLKRLDVPMTVLGQPQSVVFLNPTDITPTMDEINAERSGNVDGIQAAQLIRLQDKVLPLTLKYLHLRSCNKWAFAFLQKINEVPAEKLKLKRIELFFETGPRTSITNCYATDEGRLNYINVLSELDQKCVKVSFYTGPKEAPVSMCKELMSLLVLSPLEAWHFATSGLEYSQLNTEASLRRRSSSIASHLFMKHVHDHFLLFNSPTFNIKAWIRVAFFHGTKWKPYVHPPNSKFRLCSPDDWPARPLGKREMARRHGSLLDLSKSSFDFQVEQTLTPLLKEVFFLGGSFTIPDYAEEQPEAGDRATTKKPYSEKEEEVMPGKSQWFGQIKEKKPMNAKKLKRRMSDAQPKHNSSSMSDTYDAHYASYEKDTKFDRGVWSGVNWEVCLRPEVDLQAEPATIDVPLGRRCSVVLVKRRQLGW